MQISSILQFKINKKKKENDEKFYLLAKAMSGRNNPVFGQERRPALVKISSSRLFL